jgi:hypothetical protein
MPALPNPKHELFAQGLASGLSQAKAYVQAGYKHDESHAGRLARKASVQARVAELKGHVQAMVQARFVEQQATAEITTRQNVVVSVSSVAAELEKAYRMAEGLEMPHAMATASLGKAKLFGLIAKPGDGFRQAGRKGEMSPIQRRTLVELMPEDELRQAILGRADEGQITALLDYFEAVTQKRIEENGGERLWDEITVESVRRMSEVELEEFLKEVTHLRKRASAPDTPPDPPKPAPARSPDPPKPVPAPPPRLEPNDPMLRKPEPPAPPPIAPLPARPQRRVLN